MILIFSFFVLILTAAATIQMSQSKYGELLAVIEEIGKDIRPTYAGSKNASERLKKGEFVCDWSKFIANESTTYYAN